MIIKEQKEVKDKSKAQAMTWLIEDALKSEENKKAHIEYALEKYNELSLDRRNYIDSDLVKRLKQAYIESKEQNSYKASSGNCEKEDKDEQPNSSDWMLTWTPPFIT